MGLLVNNHSGIATCCRPGFNLASAFCTNCVLCVLFGAQTAESCVFLWGWNCVSWYLLRWGRICLWRHYIHCELLNKLCLNDSICLAETNFALRLVLALTYTKTSLSLRPFDAFRERDRSFVQRCRVEPRSQRVICAGNENQEFAGSKQRSPFWLNNKIPALAYLFSPGMWYAALRNCRWAGTVSRREYYCIYFKIEINGSSNTRLNVFKQFICNLQQSLQLCNGILSLLVVMNSTAHLLNKKVNCKY